MKTALILLFCGVVAAIGFVSHFGNSPPGAADSAGLEQAAAQIRTEMAETGQVIRNKARVVGGRLEDARIVALIKGKLIVDANLSALAISVECRDGAVVLRGAVDSPDQVRRAVTLAKETGGVRQVDSHISLRS